MNWRLDWGLRLRMSATLVLIVALYCNVAVALVNYTTGPRTVVFALLGVGFAGVHYYVTGPFLRACLGAHDASRDEYPSLYASVDRLAHQADVPTPTITVVDSSVPNAFVAGHTQRSAVLTVTTGLLEALEGDELEAVFAHEIAHIKNRDAAVMTFASFLPTVALLLLVASGVIGNSRERGYSNGALLLLAPVSVLVWLVGSLFVRSLSRYREFAADRGAVTITGNPAALVGALTTLENEIERTPDEDLRGLSELNAFFVVPVPDGFVGRFVSTHPPIERRIERLRALEQDRVATTERDRPATN